MRSRPARLLIAACGLAGLVAFPAAAPAQAASGLTWQISADLPGADGVAQLVDIVATGPDTALAGGTSGYLPLIERWNGTSWANVTPTGKAFRTPGTRVDAIGTSSPSNTWGLVSSASNGYAMRWNGSGWTKYSFHEYLNMYGIAVESPTDVWAFGMTGDYQPFARRFNGHRWIKVAMPGVPLAVSALSRSNIYAVGPTTASSSATSLGPARDILMQWTGKSWHIVKFPGLRMTSKQAFFPVDVLATPRDGIWVTGDVQQAPNGVVLRHDLLHWTGKRWQVFGSPVSLGSLTADGAGGFWMTDFTTSGPESFVHFRKGSWQLTPIPLPASAAPSPEALMSAITLIPGTNSVWAAGAFVTYGYDAIIYRYGS